MQPSRYSRPSPALSFEFFGTFSRTSRTDPSLSAGLWACSRELFRYISWFAGLLGALPGPRVYPGSCRELFGAFRSIFLIWGVQEFVPARFREIRPPGPPRPRALSRPPLLSLPRCGVGGPGRVLVLPPGPASPERAFLIPWARRLPGGASFVSMFYRVSYRCRSRRPRGVSRGSPVSPGTRNRL